MIKLINLSLKHDLELYKMYQDIPKEEIGSTNPINGMDYNEYSEKIEEYIRNETVIDEKLNTTTTRYVLYKDDYPIGEAGIRTTLNDYWINRGSQIFYKIRISERNKGYGNIILKLALKECKKVGMKQVRINCNDNNIKSKSIILKNGGIVDIKGYKAIEGYSSSYIIKL